MNQGIMCSCGFLALKLNRVESKVSVTLNCYLAISALQHTDVILGCICMLVANKLAFTSPTSINTTAYAVLTVESRRLMLGPVCLAQQ